MRCSSSMWLVVFNALGIQSTRCEGSPNPFIMQSARIRFHFRDLTRQIIYSHLLFLLSWRLWWIVVARDKRKRYHLDIKRTYPLWTYSERFIKLSSFSSACTRLPPLQHNIQQSCAFLRKNSHIRRIMIHHRIQLTASGYDENIYLSYGTFIIAQQANTHTHTGGIEVLHQHGSQTDAIYNHEGSAEECFMTSAISMFVLMWVQMRKDEMIYTGREKRLFTIFCDDNCCC